MAVDRHITTSEDWLTYVLNSDQQYDPKHTLSSHKRNVQRLSVRSIHLHPHRPLHTSARQQRLLPLSTRNNQHLRPHSTHPTLPKRQRLLTTNLHAQPRLARRLPRPTHNPRFTVHNLQQQHIRIPLQRRRLDSKCPPKARQPGHHNPQLDKSLRTPDRRLQRPDQPRRRRHRRSHDKVHPRLLQHSRNVRFRARRSRARRRRADGRADPGRPRSGGVAAAQFRASVCELRHASPGARRVRGSGVVGLWDQGVECC